MYRTDLKKSLSRTLTNEDIDQNAIIAKQSITAIIIYPRLSAVPQAADKMRHLIRRPFQPERDDTRDPKNLIERFYQGVIPNPDNNSFSDSPPNMTLSPSHILQLSHRNEPKVITNVICKQKGRCQLTLTQKNNLINQITLMLDNLIEVVPTATTPAIESSVDKPLEMLTIKECAALVDGLSEHTVRMLCTQDKIAHVRAGAGRNGKILVSKVSLLRYLGIAS